MATISNGMQAKLRQMAHREGVITQQRAIKQFQHGKIFPFELVNGGTLLTETGYKPNNSKITDYGKAIEVFNSGVVEVMGQDSTTMYQKDKDKPDQFYTCDYKVGKYGNAVIVQDESGVDFGSMNFSVDFKTMETKRQYTLLMSEDFLKPDDYLKFFVVFNDNNENIGGGTDNQNGSVIDTNQDRQGLYISSVINYYSPYIPNRIAYQLITFSSINDRLFDTGQNITTFIQTAKPGDGYCFPTIKNGVVGVDEQLIREIGVKYMGINTQGVMALSTAYCYGRPVIQGNSPVKTINDKGETVYRKKVYAPRLLIAGGNNLSAVGGVTNNGGVLSGITDPLAVNTHPSTSGYNVIDAEPTGFLNYKSWRDSMKAQVYDTSTFAQKDFNGMIKFDKVKTQATNAGVAHPTVFMGGFGKVFYDSTGYINGLGSYEINNSLFFNYKGEDNVIINNGQQFTFKTDCKVSEVFAFNAFLFQPYIMLPFALDQFLPFQINTIPLIGKFLNAVSFGLDPQFVIQQKTINLFQKINFFSSKQIVDFVASDYGLGKDGDTINNVIPMTLFSNNGDNQIGNLLGAKVDTFALTVKLTDRIKCDWFDYSTKQLGGQDSISTVDLLQKINRGGADRVYVADSNLVIDDITTAFTGPDTDTQGNPTPTGQPTPELPNDYGYVIDSVVIQALYEGDYRISFYEDNPFANTSLPYELMVGQAYVKSASAMSGNLFNGTTFYKCGVDTSDLAEQTTFSYPANILPPIPQNIAQNVVFYITSQDFSYADNDPSCHVLQTVNSGSSRYGQDNTDAGKSSLANKPTPKMLSKILYSDQQFEPSLGINSFSQLKKFYSSIFLELAVKDNMEFYSPDQIYKENFSSVDRTHSVDNSGTATFSIKIDLSTISTLSYGSNGPTTSKFSKYNEVTPVPAYIYSLSQGYYEMQEQINVFSVQNGTFSIKQPPTPGGTGPDNAMTSPNASGLYIYINIVSEGIEIGCEDLPANIATIFQNGFNFFMQWEEMFKLSCEIQGQITFLSR